jgi:allantoicase
MAESFTSWPDLASRDLGGSVVYASDELFAEKENLIKPAPPGFAPGDFGNKGKIYDGWETRRRREPGHDFAIVRLGRPGIVHGVVADTSFFRGNYPPRISVEAACADGYPSPAELASLSWHSLVERSAASGDSHNGYPVADRRRWTHVRLSIYPDGGVARLRVHGEVVPDPAFMTGTIDLAALENGGRVTGCSDAFYSPPEHLIMPGLARVMSDGWENARRRGPGNDYVEVRLAAPGVIRHVEIDTSCFVGNAPGWVILSVSNAARGGPVAARPPEDSPPEDSPENSPPAGGPAWLPILPRTRVQPDTRHRFLIDGAPVAHQVRLDVLPDGGLARLRIFGEVTSAAAESLRERWERTTHVGY